MKVDAASARLERGCERPGAGREAGGKAKGFVL